VWQLCSTSSSLEGAVDFADAGVKYAPINVNIAWASKMVRRMAFMHMNQPLGP
jgi:hypothetical protein